MADANTTQIFTATSAFSIAGVFGALVFAYVGLVKLLAKTASRTERITFVWLVSDLTLKLANVCVISQRIKSLTIVCLRRSTR